jgi:hypothetical protein
MARDIFDLAKALVRKAWGALTLLSAPAPQPRPQLAGRHGYGDRGIKQPNR